jgi:hypothetical protein
MAVIDSSDPRGNPKPIQSFRESWGWMAEIGDLRENNPLKVVMGDIGGENKSKALQE